MHMLTVMIVGLAMGTTLSQAVSVAVSLLVIVKRNTGISLTKADLRPDRAVMGRLLKIGVPVALQDGFIQISFMVIANRRGLTDAAAVGIVEKIIGFLFLVPSSMLSTVSALGAQNIGAGKPERAKATLGCAIAITLDFTSLIVILVEFLAEPMVGLFTPDDTVIHSGGQYLLGYIWDCFFAGVQFSFSGYFCAIGRSGLSFPSTTPCPFFWSVFPAPTWPPASSRRPCCPWAWLAPPVPCSPFWSA